MWRPVWSGKLTRLKKYVAKKIADYTAIPPDTTPTYMCTGSGFRQYDLSKWLRFFSVSFNSTFAFIFFFRNEMYILICNECDHRPLFRVIGTSLPLFSLCLSTSAFVSSLPSLRRLPERGRWGSVLRLWWWSSVQLGRRKHVRVFRGDLLDDEATLQASPSRSLHHPFGYIFSSWVHPLLIIFTNFILHTILFPYLCMS